MIDDDEAAATRAAETPLPLQLLARTLQAHGVQASEHNGWLLPFDRLPCVTADWQRRDERMGTLAVVAHLGDRREVVEVFLGLGETDQEAIEYAFESFSIGALHEMLAAIWDVREGTGDDGDDEEEAAALEAPELWHINGQTYELFEGAWQTRGERLTCPQLWDRLQGAIEALPLTEDLHWFRIFVGGQAGSELTFEALKDSEPWPEGQEMLRSLPWEAGEKYGSIRHFLMLRKQGAAESIGQEKSTAPH